MKIKKSELYFYEMLRNFLYKYLVVQRKFSPATVKNYTDSLDQYRQYLRQQKGIPFDKVGFQCFSKEMIYGFCVWLRDDQNKAVSTINLRLSAIKSFLCYCSEEDVTALVNDMIDNIEVEILNKYKILTTIHMDPIDTSDEQVLKLREEVREAVKRLDPSYNIHDFRIVKGVTHTNLVFDVLIPAEDKIDHETLKKSIFEEVSKIDPSYRCVIQVDHSFV